VVGGEEEDRTPDLRIANAFQITNFIEPTIAAKSTKA
jgi:hypothetical protein